jgi:hypothetical protein
VPWAASSRAKCLSPAFTRFRRDAEAANLATPRLVPGRLAGLGSTISVHPPRACKFLDAEVWLCCTRSLILVCVPSALRALSPLLLSSPMLGLLRMVSAPFAAFPIADRLPDRAVLIC